MKDQAQNIIKMGIFGMMGIGNVANIQATVQGTNAMERSYAKEFGKTTNR